MDMMLLTRAFAIIILIFLGYLFKKKGHFNQQTIDSINGIVFKMVLPAFLFISFLGIDFETKFLLLPVAGIILALTLLGFGFLASYMLKVKDTYFKFAMTTFEGGMIAYPVFSMFFGADKVFMVALLDLGNAILFFTVIMVLLAKHNDKPILAALKDSLPILAAMFLGLIFNALDFTSLFSGSLAYDVIIEALTLLSIPMVTLVTLSIGIDLELDFKSFLKPLKIIIARYILSVTLAIIIFETLLASFGFDSSFRHALIIFSLAPSSLLLPALVPREERKMMSSLTGLFVPLSIITLMAYGIFFI